MKTEDQFNMYGTKEWVEMQLSMQHVPLTSQQFQEIALSWVNSVEGRDFITHLPPPESKKTLIQRLKNWFMT